MDKKSIINNINRSNITENKKRIRKKSIRKNSFSKEVFKFLIDKSLEALDLTTTLIIDPSKIIQKFSYSGGGPVYYSRQICYFERSPYFEKIDNKYYVTPKGRIKIIKDILKNKLDKEVEWNGFWWAIAFDIPEKRKRARDLLRSELKSMHFIEAQKSIWVTPYDVEKELLVLLKLWLKDLSGNIKIFKIEKIIDDTELKKQFEIE